MDFVEQGMDMLSMPPELSTRDLTKLYKLDVTETLESWAVFMRESNRPHETTIEWNGPRRPFVLHPSAVDNPCDFFLYLEYVGGPGNSSNSPSMQMILDTGTAVHSQMQYYQETRADYHGYEYKAEVGFNPDNNHNCKVLRMSGHADGVSTGWPIKPKLVWEYKSINKAGFERLTSPHPAYVKQTHLYMLAVGAAMAFIVYICKDNSQVKTFKVKFNEEVWGPLLERVLRIRQHAMDMEDPEKRIGPSCRRCKHLDECEPDLSGVREFGRFPTRVS